MAESVTIQKVYRELRELKKEMVFIRKNMLDPDKVMTLQESKRFEQSLKELKAGKTTSLVDLKKELKV